LNRPAFSAGSQHTAVGGDGNRIGEVVWARSTNQEDVRILQPPPGKPLPVQGYVIALLDQKLFERLETWDIEMCPIDEH
jgi:hypothetical protein